MMRDRSGRVAGIVLAAGTSSRMGKNKLLFTLEGETILRRAVRQAAAADLDPVIVVLGYEADRARLEVEGYRCQVVVNADYERGMNSSLRAGLAAVPGEVSAAVVLLADMPFVTAAMLGTLVTRYREGTAPLVISEYGGTNAPPMLYGRSLFPELSAPEGEGSGRQVVRRYRSEAEVITWPAMALIDMDVPEDSDRVEANRRGASEEKGATE